MEIATKQTHKQLRGQPTEFPSWKGSSSTQCSHMRETREKITRKYIRPTHWTSSNKNKWTIAEQWVRGEAPHPDWMITELCEIMQTQQLKSLWRHRQLSNRSGSPRHKQMINTPATGYTKPSAQWHTSPFPGTLSEDTPTTTYRIVLRPNI